jgi:hypothetical protein
MHLDTILRAGQLSSKQECGFGLARCCAFITSRQRSFAPQSMRERHAPTPGTEALRDHTLGYRGRIRCSQSLASASLDPQPCGPVKAQEGRKEEEEEEEEEDGLEAARQLALGEGCGPLQSQMEIPPSSTGWWMREIPAGFILLQTMWHCRGGENARTTSGMRLASADTILMYSSAVAGRLPSSRYSSTSSDGTGRARRGSISSSPSSPDLTKSFAIDAYRFRVLKLRRENRPEIGFPPTWLSGGRSGSGGNSAPCDRRELSGEYHVDAGGVL